MTSGSTLPDDAVAFESLRARGIRLLERMAGGRWTDFNAHDPGITILELLCYALTDLGYRTSFPLPDLLANGGADPYAGLYGPSRLLTTCAVTDDDVRKVAIDVRGVRDAHVEPSTDHEILAIRPVEGGDWTLYPKPREFLGSGDPGSEVVRLLGLSRVRIDVSHSGAAPERELLDKLHVHRGLCEDFELVPSAVVGITVDARVEIGMETDAAAVHREILQRLSDYLSPTVTIHDRGELLARGVSGLDVFDGPRLDRGVVLPSELRELRHRSKIHTSDLIREIMDVPGVRTVVEIGLGGTGASTNAWTIVLEDGAVARLAEDSEIELLRHGVAVNPGAAVGPVIPEPPDPSPRAGAEAERRTGGRDRAVHQYRSVQQHLPRAYGVGPAGLPRSAPPARRAQARQLQGYLAIFDQLLANQFAQLGHLNRLLSFDDDSPDTYFLGAIEDGEQLDGVLPSDHGRDARLQVAVQGAGAAATTRKDRLLNHLLARFAEQLPDYAGDEGVPEAERARRRQAIKAEFLRRYPHLSAARGNGLDYRRAETEANTSGLLARVRLALGMTAEEHLFLVEHILLRPLEQDRAPRDVEADQEMPVLKSEFRDPYSFRLTFVFPASGRFAGKPMRRRVWTTVRRETPAHLVPRICWHGRARVEGAFRSWQERLRAYALHADKSEPGAHIPLRDARDRLLEILDIGATFPILDLPVRSPRKVSHGSGAVVAVDFSQKGVLYRLFDRDTPVGDGPVEGNGGTLELPTPAIEVGVTYRVAVDRVGAVGNAELRYALYQTATIRVGLDTGLVARILDLPTIGDPPSPPRAQPRIADHATAVTVEIEDAQEGVDYRLVTTRAGEEVVLSIADVRGQGHGLGVQLRSQPILVDTDLRIRATKQFSGAAAETELLEAMLPLKVRPDARLDVAAAAPVVDHAGTATIVIGASEETASYQLFVRAVPDGEFLRRLGGGPLDPHVPSVAAAAPDGTVHAEPPARANPWSQPEGYEPVGQPRQGSGGELRLEVPGLHEDSVVVVRAEKMHAVGIAADPERELPSAVQLEQAVLVLVRPIVDVPLALQVHVDGQGSITSMRVRGGQPGVFYHFRSEPEGDPVSRPAYFHKVHPVEEQSDKGVDRLAVEVDFVVGGSRRGTNPREFLFAPLLDVAGVSLDSELVVRAEKAQTGVAVDLAERASLPKLPRIRPDAPIVAPGTPGAIEVLRSREDEQYELRLDGETVGSPIDGTGLMITLPTGPLQADVLFDVVARPREPGGLAVERVAQVAIFVGPANAEVTLVAGIVDHGGRAAVTVSPSAPGILYALHVGEDRVADPVAGSGGPIQFESPELTADVTFTVRAVRLDRPGVAVDLEPELSVVTRPDPALEVTAEPATVASGGVARITVAGSQEGVEYALLVGSNRVTDPVAGNGGAVVLTTPQLAEPTTFVVRATKAADAEAFADVGEPVVIDVT